MHTALKAAREEEALRSMAKGLGEIGPRLEAIERQVAEILDLLKVGQGQSRGGNPPPIQRGGR